MRRVLLAVTALTLALGGCSNLGLGEASCLPPDRGVSSANVLTVQAVPDAKYTPCLDELRLGWDNVEWFAEDGRAGIRVSRSMSPFLTATVTPSCDVSGATEVESGYDDIERYEDIEFHPVDIGVAIIPSGERALAASRLLLEELEGTEVDDRPVVFMLDENVDYQVENRLNLALLRGQYAWIVNELGAEEGTVDLRSDDPGFTRHGISTTEALELIDDSVPDVFYRGNWYFTFEGGCITYEFNASGQLSETVAADAEDAFGFYPAYVITDAVRRQGFDI